MTSGHSHAPTANLLKAGEMRVLAAGQRWTKPRQHVLTTLVHATAPLSAYDVLEQMSKRLRRRVSPPSVYRALKALVDLGIVIRIESLNAYMVCKYFEAEHQHVLLVCDDCGKTDEMDDHHLAQQLQKSAARSGFSSTRQVLEMHGQCAHCKGGAQPS